MMPNVPDTKDWTWARMISWQPSCVEPPEAGSC
jgi:hypothetical protein